MPQHSDYIGATREHWRRAAMKPRWLHQPARRRGAAHAQDIYGPGSVDPRATISSGQWNSPDLGGNFGGPVHGGSIHLGTVLTYGLIFAGGWFVGTGGLKKYLK